MKTAIRMTLDEYLGLEYPFNVIADPDGGYVIEFPDLKGCLTQADTLDEIASMAAEARSLWIEAAYEHGIDIPLPSYPAEYSGKFVLRLPRSLHRKLAESAERDGVSLNQYVVMLLSAGDAVSQTTKQLSRIEDALKVVHDRLPNYQVSGTPKVPHDRSRLKVVYAGDEVTGEAVAV